jgi:hypothetical protein
LVAFVAGGALRVSDLDRCRTRTLVAHTASPPVRFSPDGRYVAFSHAEVADLAGHSLQRPLGAGVVQWAWAPGDVLVGVTGSGALVAGRPGARPRRLLPVGWGALGVVVSPDGRDAAVARASQPGHRVAAIWTIDVRTGRRQRIYRAAGRTFLQVAGYAPGGRGVLLFAEPQASGSLAADGAKLEAINGAEASPVTLSALMLPYRDWVRPCGARHVVYVDGGGRQATMDKRLEWAQLPGGTASPLTPDGRSFVAPDCAAAPGRPEAMRIAAASSPSRAWRYGHEHRAIAVLSLNNGQLQRDTSPPRGFSDEDPTWLGGNRWLAFVRMGASTHGTRPGRLYVLDTRRQHLIGPILPVGASSSYYGHYRWRQRIDFTTR